MNLVHRKCLHRTMSGRNSRAINTLFDASAVISFMNTLLALDTTLFTAISDSGLKKCFAYITTSDESAF